MCLIIEKPAGVDVPLDVIESALDYNRDGVGIMANGSADRWVKIGARKVQRKVNALGSAAIHFRMATHGRIDHTNVHPFRAADGTYIMHNGILGKYAPIMKMSAISSDTQCFVRDYVNPMLQRAKKIDLQAIANESSGSALALMAPDGKIELTGTSWVSYSGLRLSNTYAWDSPIELRGAWSYDAHDDSAVGASELPADYKAPFERHYPAIYNAYANDDRAGELEDLLLGELVARVDEIDFANERLVRHFDTLDYGRLLGGTLAPEDFLERMDASGLLACRVYLATREDA